MRLLFVYTEFLNRDGTVNSHRGFSQLSLNFSTDRRFSYQDGALTVMLLEHPIPPDFFGERIYNVTILVGDNGAGKTTVLHYLIDLLRQLYEGSYRGNDRGLLVMEDQGKTYVLEYHGDHPIGLEDIPAQFVLVRFPEYYKLLSHTKLIYLANTLTSSDLELVRHRPEKTDDKYVNLFHFRHEFLYNCSTASLMVENCKNDSGNPLASAAEYLNGFFRYEQYKQVKYVFDKKQYDILAGLQKEEYPVPVPDKLTVELQLTDYSTIFNGIDNNSERREAYRKTLEGPSDRLVLELCNSCVVAFLKTAMLHTDTRDKLTYWEFVNRDTERWTSHYSRKRPDISMFREALEDIYHIYKHCEGSSQSEDSLGMIEQVKTCCDDFIQFVFQEKEHFQQYFTMQPLPAESINQEEKTITFSVETTGEAAEWFITFLQKYRYTCEPYYYLNFHWGLSSGEQNLLRLFSSLYYIFDADYNNPARGDYQIFNMEQGNHKISCDSVLLWLDEADLTYHPEWQRRFLSILTAFLPKMYPESCCRDIQIFLTTHSPLMLGDSPAQSVIYLSKDACKQVRIDDSGSRQTFGENLYTLLQNNFDVRDGAIGELVRIKIQKILKTLEDANQQMQLEASSEEVSFEKIRHCQNDLRKYRDGVVAFLADGIIKAKLETEIDRCLQQLEKYIPSAKYKRETPFEGWSDAELKKQLEILTAELERRKEEF